MPSYVHMIPPLAIKRHGGAKLIISVVNLRYNSIIIHIFSLFLLFLYFLLFWIFLKDHHARTGSAKMAWWHPLAFVPTGRGLTIWHWDLEPWICPWKANLWGCLASCQWDSPMFPQDKTVRNMFGKCNYCSKFWFTGPIPK